MATRKSSPLIAVGLAIFVIACAFAFVALHGNKAPRPVASAPARAGAAGGGGAAGPASAGAPAGNPLVPFAIPAGKNAVPVQVSSLGGLDGYGHAGDLINVFANVTKSKTNLVGGNAPPATKLVLSNIKVLAVLAPPPSPSPAGTAVFVLALDPGQAEQLIFLSTNESLYFSLVPPDAPPTASGGRTYQNAL